MEHQPQLEIKRFGEYLRSIRERRKLSLDSVEELSLSYVERVTKSHLSRIENGQAVPTFPRMFVLSQIYGVPVSSLAEQFEIDLLRGMASGDYGDTTPRELLERAREYRRSGGHVEALRIYSALLERHTGPTNGTGEVLDPIDLRLGRAECLVKLGRYASAKEECEDLLSGAPIDLRQRILCLYFFTTCCHSMRKYTIANMAVDQFDRLVADLPNNDRLRALLSHLRGRVKYASRDYTAARDAFRDATDRFVELEDSLEACRSSINLAVAQGELGERREASERLHQALEEAKQHGYPRQIAHAQSELAVLAFQDGDFDIAEAYCLQSNLIARKIEFAALVFRNSYYLWRISLEKGDQQASRSAERTLRAYWSRAEGLVKEADEYRDHVAGGGR